MNYMGIILDIKNSIIHIKAHIMKRIFKSNHMAVIN
jgi:hypothetical protein